MIHNLWSTDISAWALQHLRKCSSPSLEWDRILLHPFATTLPFKTAIHPCCIRSVDFDASSNAMLANRWSLLLMCRWRYTCATNGEYSESDESLELEIEVDIEVINWSQFSNFSWTGEAVFSFVFLYEYIVVNFLLYLRLYNKKRFNFFF